MGARGIIADSFLEVGVAMLSSVFLMDGEIQANVRIMKAFSTARG